MADECITKRLTTIAQEPINCSTGICGSGVTSSLTFNNIFVEVVSIVLGTSPSIIVNIVTPSKTLTNITILSYEKYIFEELNLITDILDLYSIYVSLYTSQSNVPCTNPYGCTVSLVDLNICKIDLCAGVICDNICIDTNLYSQKCVAGECVQDVLTEENSIQCGYIEPKKPFPWWLLLLLGYITYKTTNQK